MSLQFYITVVLGTALSLYGLLFLTRKKFMLSRLYDTTLMNIMIILVPTIQIYRGYGYSYLIIVFLPLTALSFLINRQKYLLSNVNLKMVTSTLSDILKEKNIAYEEFDKAFKLEKYNRTISFTQSFNTVEINLNDIKDLDFLKDLKEELKTRIKEINDDIFPAMGIFYLGLGGFMIAVALYLGSKLNI